MSNNKQPQGFLTLGASRKRKERDVFGGGGGSFDAFALKPSKKATTPTMANNYKRAEPSKLKPSSKEEDNRLLAGYLAHEFLTKGTLLGQKWDPARAEAIPISPRRPNLMMKVRKPVGGGGADNNVKVASASAAAVAEPMMKKHESYAEVANLLKSDGVHIEGIVNPTQLARWFKM